jgi:hypothetical protein
MTAAVTTVVATAVMTVVATAVMTVVVTVAATKPVVAEELGSDSLAPSPIPTLFRSRKPPLSSIAFEMSYAHVSSLYFYFQSEM